MDYNLDECLQNANDFFQISCIIDRKRLEFSYKYLSVLITNLSFSCELYLKYILLKNGYSTKKIGRTHDLRSLFNCIQTCFLDVFKCINNFYKEEKPITSIEQLLNRCGTNFLEFRYLYEHKKHKYVYTTDLAAFARALKKYCNVEFSVGDDNG